VLRILSSNELCSMATRGSGGRVHINTAFFCHGEDLALFFLSDPGSVHCRNLASSSRMAVAVFDTRQAWGAAHEGLQMFGDCAPALGTVAERAGELYSARFPGYATLAPRLSHLRLYGFTPRRIKILDEDEFGGEVFVTAEVRTGGGAA
jgi:uncharacterized protein YhbP (UPF0306 family)